MAIIEPTDIVLGKRTARGTVSAWLEGPLWQSVGTNPIELSAEGRTEEELLQEAVERFTQGHRLALGDGTDYAMTTEEIIAEWETQMHAYVDGRYGPYLRESLISIFVDPRKPQAMKDEIMKAWDWVEMVTGYWMACAAQVTAGTPPEEVGWNLKQFDGLDPGITLQGLMAVAR